MGSRDFISFHDIGTKVSPFSQVNTGKKLYISVKKITSLFILAVTSRGKNENAKNPLGRVEAA